MFLLYTFLWFYLYFYLRKVNSFNINYNSYFVAFVHANISVLINGLNYYFIDRYKNWDSEYNIISNQAISISLGYFMYDLYHTIFTNFNKIYIIHHSLSIFTLLFSYRTQTCSKLVSTFLLFGELSNPLQIIWYLSDKLGYPKLEEIIFPIYSFLFVSIRTLIVPYLMLNILFEYYNNYYIIFYCLCYTLGLIGSFKWTKKIVKKIIKRYVKP